MLLADYQTAIYFCQQKIDKLSQEQKMEKNKSENIQNVKDEINTWSTRKQKLETELEKEIVKAVDAL